MADRDGGPYAGVHRMPALEFLARWVDHVPERYEVRVRYAGAYATGGRVVAAARSGTGGSAGGAAPVSEAASAKPSRDCLALGPGPPPPPGGPCRPR